MNTHRSTLAVTSPHDLNRRLFDELLDDDLIEAGEHARAVKRPLEHALDSRAQALAALVCNGVVSRKRFVTLGVRTQAERRLLRGQERLRIVQEAGELMTEMEQRRHEERLSRGPSTFAWMGDLLLGVCVLFIVFA